MKTNVVLIKSELEYDISCNNQLHKNQHYTLHVRILTLIFSFLLSLTLQIILSSLFSFFTRDSDKIRKGKRLLINLFEYSPALVSLAVSIDFGCYNTFSDQLKSPN